MKKSEGKVVAVALEYEMAVLDALDALMEDDREAKLAAFLRFADARDALAALPAKDHAEAQGFLRKRGKISDQDWRKVATAMEIFDATRNPNASATLN